MNKNKSTREQTQPFAPSMRTLHQLNSKQKLYSTHQQTAQIQRQSKRTQSQRHFINDHIFLGSYHSKLFGSEELPNIVSSNRRNLQQKNQRQQRQQQTNQTEQSEADEHLFDSDLFWLGDGLAGCRVWACTRNVQAAVQGFVGRREDRVGVHCVLGGVMQVWHVERVLLRDAWRVQHRNGRPVAVAGVWRPVLEHGGAVRPREAAAGRPIRVEHVLEHRDHL